MPKTKKLRTNNKLLVLAAKVRSAEGKALQLRMSELRPTFGETRPMVRGVLGAVGLGIYPDPAPADGKGKVIVFAREAKVGLLLDACRHIDEETVGRLLDALSSLPSPLPEISADWTPVRSANSQKVAVCRWTPTDAEPWTEQVTRCNATAQLVIVEFVGSNPKCADNKWTLRLHPESNGWVGEEKGQDWAVRVRSGSVTADGDELYVDGMFDMVDHARIYTGTFKVTVSS